MPPVFLNKALDFVSSTTIAGVFWGVNFFLYFLCTQLFYRRYHKAPDERKKLVFSFIYNSVMVLMAGLELGTNTSLMRLSYINHGGVHGEPEQFMAAITHSSAMGVLDILTSFAIPILNSLVQLWRVWVIWEISSYKYVVTISLSFLLVATEAIKVYYLANPIHESTVTPDELKVFGILLTAQAALSFAFTLLVTILLAGRIIVMGRRHNRLMGTTSENAKQYTSTVAMLVESYALDSIWTIGGIITFALFSGGNPVELKYLFNNTGDQVTVIAFLLVTYRVLSKRAWTPKTGRQLSTLRWNHNDTEDTTTDQTTSTDRLPPIAMGPSKVAEENSGSLA